MTQGPNVAQLSPQMKRYGDSHVHTLMCGVGSGRRRTGGHVVAGLPVADGDPPPLSPPTGAGFRPWSSPPPSRVSSSGPRARPLQKDTWDSMGAEQPRVLKVWWALGKQPPTSPLGKAHPLSPEALADTGGPQAPSASPPLTKPSEGPVTAGHPHKHDSFGLGRTCVSRETPEAPRGSCGQ